MKAFKIWYTIPLCISTVFLFLSFISKKLIEMNCNTNAIPLYNFTVYINTMLLFSIPLLLYMFLSFGINFTTIMTGTEKDFPLTDIAKWLALAFIFPLITESFYAINYYIYLNTIFLDNDSLYNITKIGAFTIEQYNLINYLGWLCVLLFMFIIQYLKYGISLIISLINSFLFVALVGAFYILFKI